MSTFEILHFPDSRLRQIAEEITVFDEELATLANKMLSTMYESKGIGLAAIQVNVKKRLVVIDVSESRDEPLFLINPEIYEKSNKIQSEEGCLSVPGFYDKVERYNNIKYKSMDFKGNCKDYEAEGLLAVCIQHEIDHLNGKLFVDYLSDLKRERIAKKIQKLSAQGKLPSRKDVPYSI